MIRSLLFVCALLPAISLFAIDPRQPSQNRPKTDSLGHENRYTSEMRMSSSTLRARPVEKGEDGAYHRKGYWDPSGRWVPGEISSRPDRFSTSYPRAYGIRRPLESGRNDNGL